MRLLLILMIGLTGCSTTKLVNIHKPLNYTEAQCEPKLTSELRKRILPHREGETEEMERERKRDVLDVADYYLAKITTLCNLANAHNKTHGGGKL